MHSYPNRAFAALLRSCCLFFVLLAAPSTSAFSFVNPKKSFLSKCRPPANFETRNHHSVPHSTTTTTRRPLPITIIYSHKNADTTNNPDHNPPSPPAAYDNAPRRREDRDLGGYDPSERIGESEVNVGDPQIKIKSKERSVTSILRELAAIQQQGPQKYCILGTRHCSYLHQQIIELLAYALVLSGNHVYTSGAGGTHAATIRGALRAERPDLLTVVLPQSMAKQPKESQELLKDVEDVIAMPQNDGMSLDVASRICNSYLLSRTDQLISFAFHESSTVIEATKEAKKLDMVVTVLYLD